MRPIPIAVPNEPTDSFCRLTSPPHNILTFLSKGDFSKYLSNSLETFPAAVPST